MNFLDICSGIGGAHLAFKNLDCNCLGYSEVNEKAEQTYKLFFGDELINYGDVMEIKANDVSNMDILIAGFPCQTFSIVGKRKGFEDERGHIIFGIKKILQNKKPKGFILENVKGLLSLDKGKVLIRILDILKSTGYNVNYKVLNSLDYGVSQMRERIYIVGLRSDLSKNKFDFAIEKEASNLKDFLINRDEQYILKDAQYNTFKYKYLNNKYNRGKFNIEYIIQEEYLVLDTRQSDLRLYRGKVPTLRTGRQGILYVNNGVLRKLSGLEALLLQGFDIELAKMAEKNISQGALLAQAGNAMTVNVMEKIGKNLLKAIV